MVRIFWCELSISAVSAHLGGNVARKFCIVRLFHWAYLWYVGRQHQQPTWNSADSVHVVPVERVVEAFRGGGVCLWLICIDAFSLRAVAHWLQSALVSFAVVRRVEVAVGAAQSEGEVSAPDGLDEASGDRFDGVVRDVAHPVKLLLRLPFMWLAGSYDLPVASWSID